MSNYLVIDLEMCRVPKGIKRQALHLSSEIIQIGAVLLDDELKVTDVCSLYNTLTFIVLINAFSSRISFSRLMCRNSSFKMPCALLFVSSSIFLLFIIIFKAEHCISFSKILLALGILNP